MLRNEYKQAKTKTELYLTYFQCSTLSIMNLFSHVFLIFNYWNFAVGMYVLRSSILQVSKKIFGKINKWGGFKITILVGGWKKFKN